MVATLPAAGSELGELDSIFQAVGQLWTAGCAIDWMAFNEGQRRRRISLPTYPFERTRYWVDPPRSAPVIEAVRAGSVSDGLEGQSTVAYASGSDAKKNGRIMQQPVRVQLRSARNDALHDSLRRSVRGLSGRWTPGEFGPGRLVFELGLDSLVLTQASRRAARSPSASRSSSASCWRNALRSRLWRIASFAARARIGGLLGREFRRKAEIDQACPATGTEPEP